MKEQFVPHEIATLLKEKGFDDECLAYWINKDKLRSCGAILFEVDGFFRNSLSSEEHLIAAPLWQQCLEWLEREHWVDFWAVPILTPNPKQYECFIMYRGKEISCEILDIRFFNSYNEARQTAIEKILTFI